MKKKNNSSQYKRMDAVTITRNFDENSLHSSSIIIIKKENIGVNKHQHQNYQYNLFNNNAKRDQFYEDLYKVKDRSKKKSPNMQQVIHMDMKRIKTNKVYERKLTRELTGPRGLNWQYKQKLQRLQSNEREATRDLMRLHRDLARVSISSLLGQQLLSHQNKDFSRLQTPRSSIISDTSSAIQTVQKTKFLRERSFSINSITMANDIFTPMHQKRLSTSKTNTSNEKFPALSKQMTSKSNCANSISQQQRRDIEQKLKKFLL